MKNIRKLSFIFFAFILTSNSFIFSQNKNFTLEDVCNSLASNPNTTGDFTQTKTIITNNRKLVSSGNFIISNIGIMWKTLKPFPSTLILTEEKMIQISASGNTSVMNGADNQIFANISETLSSVFSGNVTKLLKNFECDFSTNENGFWQVKLSPKDSSIASVIKTITLSGYYKNQATLDSLLMTESSNNTILYEFSNQQYPKELSSDDKKIFTTE